MARAEESGLFCVILLARGFMRSLVFLAILLMVLPGQTAMVQKRKYPCKTPELAASSYWTHGRLSVWNGTPSFRLWKIGTTRMLGIYSGPSTYPETGPRADNEDPEFPANIREKFRPTHNWIYADFEVCPLEPEKPHTMQAVCIEAAKNISVKSWDD